MFIHKTGLRFEFDYSQRVVNRESASCVDKIPQVFKKYFSAEKIADFYHFLEVFFGFL